MAANQNNRGRSNQPNYGTPGQSPFFNQSLGGGLTVESLSGPLLFTPVPLSSPSHDSNTTEGNIAQTETGNNEQPHQTIGYQSPLQPLQSPFPQSSVTQAPIPQPSFSQNDLFPVQSSSQPDLYTQPFIPANQSQSAPSLASYPSSPFATSSAPLSQPQPPPPSIPQPFEQYGASPGMQYMDMPFQDSAHNQGEAGLQHQESTANAFKPTQVVTPQPNLQGRPQFYTPSGQPVTYPFQYQPAQPHWFYQNDGKVWLPFSFIDSRALEAAFTTKEKTVIATDGGRYDVDLDSLKREAVYWKAIKTDVRRCTWFYRGEGETKLIPYDENLADLLEKEFKAIATTGTWNKKIDLPKGETIIFHNANVIVHYRPSTEMLDWTGEDSKSRPRVVRRGISDIMDEILEGEPEQIDHLVFIVHGIGPAADLRMRPIVDCVEDMRQQGLLQLGTHQFVKEGIAVGRVEFLPIEWYTNLHSDRHGVDSRLDAITLSSIGKFRNFTNETLTDILFFTSPMYCQAICDTVVKEMNRLLQLFKSRNPSYQGEISVCGHSLGSCILFDILANQVNVESNHDMEEVVEEVIERVEEPDSESTFAEDDQVDSPPALPPVVTQSLSQTYASTVQEDSIPDINDVLKKLNLSDYSSKFDDEKIDTETLLMCSEADMRDLGIPMGPRKKLMGFVREQAQQQEKKRVKEVKPETPPQWPITAPKSEKPQKAEKPKQMIMKGTQTYLFRSFSSASVEVAYERGVAGTGQPTVHYSKLDFEPTHMFALGSPLGLFVTVRGVTSFGMKFKLPTCSSFYNIFHPYDPVAYRIEPLVNPQIDIPPVLMPHHKGRKRFHLELRENLTRVGSNLKQGFIEAVRSTWETINHFARSHRGDANLDIDEEVEETETAVVKPLQSQTDGEKGLKQQESTEEPSGIQIDCGRLNNGKRIDYVLQERPVEILNEYLFALSSHACYWTSEDTVLLMLRAIYGAE